MEGLGGRNGFGPLRTREEAPGWLALVSQEEGGQTEGEHIRERRGKPGRASPRPSKNGSKVREHHVEKNFPHSWSHPDGMGCSGGQRSAPPPKLISAVLKNVLHSSGVEFGFTVILITCRLVRFSPSL